MDKILTFWEFVTERHAIYLRRQAGQPWPWTENKILQEYYFCNIFRELDKTTIWFKDNVREPLANYFDVVMATVIFRWFNRVDTGEKLLKHNLYRQWHTPTALLLLENQHPVVTGAYIIKTPNGMDKLNGVCWCIDQMWNKRLEIRDYMTDVHYLQDAWQYISKFPYQGPFMSYEVVTDLRHTCVLRSARDIHGWANIGPGAARGLGYLKLAPTQQALLKLLGESTRAFMYGPMEMRDIEHSLCEYAKYRNAGTSQPMKRRYHHGSSCS